MENIDKQIAELHRQMQPWPSFIYFLKVAAVMLPVDAVVMWATVHAAVKIAMWWPV